MHKDAIYKAKALFADWICSHADFDTFITLTLKQAIPCNTYRGQLVPINRDACVKTAMIFRDRLSRNFLGTGRVRAGNRLPFAPFVEGNQLVRTHLHFVTAKPQSVSLTDFRMEVCKVANILEWTHRHIDTRPITYGKPEFVVNYCLKTGTDAFLPEAAFLPSHP